MTQRGLNYQHEPDSHDIPIIDSAYVTLPFRESSGDVDSSTSCKWKSTIGCLELCMFAEGSRHQEEIIVTGTNGRLEAYLPENSVYFYERPSFEEWADRSIPPSKHHIKGRVYDCSNVKEVHGIDNDIPTHGGYHYSSTAVEWYYLLSEMRRYRDTGVFNPQVSLNDGLRAVEIGIQATSVIVNELDDDC